MGDEAERHVNALLEHFEGTPELVPFLKLLLNLGVGQINVQSVAYAQLLSKLVDVSELVDFGQPLGRRGHLNLETLRARKAQVASEEEFLPIGCESEQDWKQRYEEVLGVCPSKVFRDARYFRTFEWQAKMFAWKRCPWVTALPLVLEERHSHYVLIHCEWLGSTGRCTDEGSSGNLTPGVWSSVWRVVEWMLFIIWSSGRCRDKPVWVCAGACIDGVETAAAEQREYTFHGDDDTWLQGPPCWTEVSKVAANRSGACPPNEQTGREVSDVRGKQREKGNVEEPVQTWRRIGLQIERAATAYKEEVLQSLRSVEDYGRYYEEGQEPGDLKVGQYVYNANKAWIGKVDMISKDKVIVVDKLKLSDLSPVGEARKKWRAASQLVIAPAKPESLREMRRELPTPGSMAVVVGGGRSDLVGRIVRVDKVTNTTCDVHFFNGGELVKLCGNRRLEITSLHVLEGGVDVRSLRCWFEDLSTEEMKHLNGTSSSGDVLKMVKERLQVDTQGFQVMVLPKTSANEKKRFPTTPVHLDTAADGTYPTTFWVGRLQLCPPPPGDPRHEVSLCALRKLSKADLHYDRWKFGCDRGFPRVPSCAKQRMRCSKKVGCKVQWHVFSLSDGTGYLCQVGEHSNHCSDGDCWTSLSESAKIAVAFLARQRLTAFDIERNLRDPANNPSI